MGLEAAAPPSLHPTFVLGIIGPVAAEEQFESAFRAAKTDTEHPRDFAGKGDLASDKEQS
jgi:hypothetical protein